MPSGEVSSGALTKVEGAPGPLALLSADGKVNRIAREAVDVERDQGAEAAGLDVGAVDRELGAVPQLGARVHLMRHAAHVVPQFGSRRGLRVGLRSSAGYTSLLPRR